MFIGEGERAKTIVNVEMRELYKIIRARLEYFTDKSDPDAFCQNVCCEVEKAMRIYPNTGKVNRNG